VPRLRGAICSKTVGATCQPKALALVSLQDNPVLAERLGCEPVENAVERELEEVMMRLTPVQRRRLQKRLAEGGDAGEGQGVA